MFNELFVYLPWYIANPAPLVLTTINGLLCVLVFWACLCRLRLTSTDTRIWPRIVFAGVMVVHVTSALRAPLFGVQVNTWWPIILTSSTWCILLADIGEWKRAPPVSMMKPGMSRPMSL